MNKAKQLLAVFSAVWVFSACAPQRAVDSAAQGSPLPGPRTGRENINSEIETATFALG